MRTELAFYTNFVLAFETSSILNLEPSGDTKIEVRSKSLLLSANASDPECISGVKIIRLLSNDVIWL